MKMRDAFEPRDLSAFEPEAKVGLIATVNPEGLPHITLITALQAKDSGHLIWGQFSEGLSKRHVRTNPRTGFLIMTMERDLWRGKALWTHSTCEGEDFQMFNAKPMFRYNAYFGIHTVHYMDLVTVTPRQRLPLARIALATLATRAAKAAVRTPESGRILSPWGQGLFNRLDHLAFIASVGQDGFPWIVPALQTQAADSRRLAFAPLAYARELKTLRAGAPLAVFGMSMQAEDILARGTFRGYSRARGLTLGAIDLTWVYNSMPPLPGQIYPPLALEPVTAF